MPRMGLYSGAGLYRITSNFEAQNFIDYCRFISKVFSWSMKFISANCFGIINPPKKLSLKNLALYMVDLYSLWAYTGVGLYSGCVYTQG